MNDSLLTQKGLRGTAIVVLIVLALFLAAETWHVAFGRAQGEPMNTITVIGTGKAAAVPNIATIDYTVTESAATVADAQTASTKKSDAALDAVKKLGVEDKDVKTIAYNVSPTYEYGRPCAPGVYCTTVVSSNPKITGYQVSQTIEVKVRDTAKAGDVLQALGTLGVEGISGPNFMVDEDGAVKNEARAEAIKDARAKAAELAKELGVHLGKVVSFYENGNAYPMYAAYNKGGAMDMSESAAAPTLPVGQNETDVSVSVTYEIR